MESLEDKTKRVTAERIEITKYDRRWPELFEEEKVHLLQCMPKGLIAGIEHFGSTAVVVILEILEPQGYDYFWRPTAGDDTPPFYSWCIKRNEAGLRTHHLHFGPVGFKDRELKFRDILRADSILASDYAKLKLRLAEKYRNDRVNYTEAKTKFIDEACGY